MNQTLRTPSFPSAAALAPNCNLRGISWSRFLLAIASFIIPSLPLEQAVQSVTLAWDASPQSDIAGYKVNYGTTSGSPSQTVDVGKSTMAAISRLNDSTTYYFSGDRV